MMESMEDWALLSVSTSCRNSPDFWSYCPSTSPDGAALSLLPAGSTVFSLFNTCCSVCCRLWWHSCWSGGVDVPALFPVGQSMMLKWGMRFAEKIMNVQVNSVRGRVAQVMYNLCCSLYLGAEGWLQGSRGPAVSRTFVRPYSNLAYWLGNGQRGFCSHLLHCRCTLPDSQLTLCQSR